MYKADPFLFLREKEIESQRASQGTLAQHEGMHMHTTEDLSTVVLPL